MENRPYTTSWLMQLQNGFMAVYCLAVIGTMYRRFGLDAAMAPLALVFCGFVFGQLLRFAKWEREMDEELERVKRLRAEAEED
jgi:hypothetical protein